MVVVLKFPIGRADPPDMPEVPAPMMLVSVTWIFEKLKMAPVAASVIVWLVNVCDMFALHQI